MDFSFYLVFLLQVEVSLGISETFKMVWFAKLDGLNRQLLLLRAPPQMFAGVLDVPLWSKVTYVLCNVSVMKVSETSQNIERLQNHRKMYFAGTHYISIMIVFSI